MSKKVLIVDDSIYMRTLISDALTGAGYEVVGQAANGHDAIELSKSLLPDLITLDNILPDAMGLDLLPQIKDFSNTSKILMISAVGQQTVINRGKTLGADDYIVKPFDKEGLVEKVQSLMNN